MAPRASRRAPLPRRSRRGLLSGACAGHVAIEWASEDGRVTFGWTESGLEDIAAPERSGFGSKLIELSVRHDLGGAMERNWNADGVAYRLDFPLGVHMS